MLIKSFVSCHKQTLAYHKKNIILFMYFFFNFFFNLINLAAQVNTQHGLTLFKSLYPTGLIFACFCKIWFLDISLFLCKTSLLNLQYIVWTWEEFMISHGTGTLV